MGANTRIYAAQQVQLVLKETGVSSMKALLFLFTRGMPRGAPPLPIILPVIWGFSLYWGFPQAPSKAATAHAHDS